MSDTHRTRVRYDRVVALLLSTGVTLFALLAGVGVIGTGVGAAPAYAERGIRSPGSESASAPDRTSVAATPPGDDQAVKAAEQRRPARRQRERQARGVRHVAQRVWLVGRDGGVRRTYLVSGSLTDNLRPGHYAVYSRSRWAVGIDDSGVMQYFVRFTHGAHAAIGFHDIPSKRRRTAADRRPSSGRRSRTAASGRPGRTRSRCGTSRRSARRSTSSPEAGPFTTGRGISPGAGQPVRPGRCRGRLAAPGTATAAVALLARSRSPAASAGRSRSLPPAPLEPPGSRVPLRPRPPERPRPPSRPPSRLSRPLSRLRRHDRALGHDPALGAGRDAHGRAGSSRSSSRSPAGRRTAGRSALLIIFQRCRSAQSTKVIGDAGGTRAAGAADAVQVGLLVLGAGVVDDVRDAGDVDAAGGDVGGDEHLQLALAELRQRPLARRLLPCRRAAGWRRSRARSRSSAIRCDWRLVRVNTIVRSGALGLEQAADHLGLVEVVGLVDELRGGRHHLGVVRRLRADVHRVPHVGAGEGDDRGRHGRREQHRLPGLGRLGRAAARRRAGSRGRASRRPRRAPATSRGEMSRARRFIRSISRPGVPTTTSTPAFERVELRARRARRRRR